MYKRQDPAYANVLNEAPTVAVEKKDLYVYKTKEADKWNNDKVLEKAKPSATDLEDDRDGVDSTKPTIAVSDAGNLEDVYKRQPLVGVDPAGANVASGAKDTVDGKPGSDYDLSLIHISFSVFATLLSPISFLTLVGNAYTGRSYLWFAQCGIFLAIPLAHRYFLPLDVYKRQMYNGKSCIFYHNLIY